MTKLNLLANAIVIAMLFSSGLVLSCTSSENKSSEIVEASDDYSNDYRDMIKNAIIEDDAESFASLARYPIYREYPLRDIADSLQMVKYFSTLVDDSLKRVLEGSTSDDWCGIGWRGTTLLDGSYLWCDEGEIYGIPYQSSKELELLDSLRRADMSSLPEYLAKGWLPESCLIDSVGTIYRIDKRVLNSEDEEMYRLLVYTKGQNRYKSYPSKILYGTLTYQGSAGTPEYTFTNPDGSIWTYWFFRYEDIHSLSIETQDDENRDTSLKKTYWLE